MGSRMLALSVFRGGDSLGLFEGADEKARGAVSDCGRDLADCHLRLHQQPFGLADPEMGQIVNEIVAGLFLEDRREVSGRETEAVGDGGET